MAKDKAIVSKTVRRVFRAFYGKANPSQMADIDPGPFYELLAEIFRIRFDDQDPRFGGMGGPLQRTIAYIEKNWDGKPLPAFESELPDAIVGVKKPPRKPIKKLIKTVSPSPIDPRTYQKFVSAVIHRSGMKAKPRLGVKEIEEMDLRAMAEDVDPSQAGQYTLDPKNQCIDFAQTEPLVLAPPAKLLHKSIYRLAGHVIERYAENYYIPGIEYGKYLVENPKKVPPELKEANGILYFFGSVLRDEDGEWKVPTIVFGKFEIHHQTFSLRDVSDSSVRMVVLKRRLRK